MICYPGGVPEIPEEDEDDDEQEPIQKQIITRILKVITVAILNYAVYFSILILVLEE